MLALLFCLARAWADEPSVLLGPAYLDRHVPLDTTTAQALFEGDWAEAARGLRAIDPGSLSGHTSADHAFLQAWALVRADRAKDALERRLVVEKAEHVPADYQALTVGELLLADGKLPEAAQVLQTVDAESLLYPRARLVLAEAQTKQGATAEAHALYEELAARPDPAEGSDIALLALAKRSGIGSDAAYAALRRLWTHYPRTPAGRDASGMLASYEAKGSKYKATPDEMAHRAESLMDGYDFAGAQALVDANAARFTEASPASCRAWYTKGRSQFKRNNVTAAAQTLIPAGKACVGHDDDLGARALYVAGKSLERKKDWSGAAQAFGLIPKLYPAHSMADDGYALGGIAHQIAKDDAAAVALWSAQVDAYPQGDLTPEALWRLAWTAYRAGDTPRAIAWADRMVDTIDPDLDPSHTMGAHYWAARWRLYGDVTSPNRLTDDTASREEGLRRLERLCRDYPHTFYAMLGSQRLRELDPERLARITRPTPTEDDGTRTVSAAFLQDRHAQTGLALARLGLVREALRELRHAEAKGPPEMALIARIERPFDELGTHDWFHHYLLDHSVGALGVDQDLILQEGFPNLWWAEVQKAVDPSYAFDPRVFHALVREESGFDPEAGSWAGAKGLSQLMPATARQTAGWLDMPFSLSQITDPEINLKIGARYLAWLVKNYDGNLFLAVPGYNAGPGNVDSWLEEYGNLPTDEIVELIPIRETRHYVKRVLGTYQAYRVIRGEGELYPDLSRFNHAAEPQEG